MKTIFTFLITMLLASVLLSAQSQSAHVQLIHNSPDPFVQTIDVYVNGELMADDVTFRSGTEFIEFPAGNLAVGLAQGNSSGPDDIISTYDYVLEEGGKYIGIASGLLSDNGYDDYEPFDIAVFEMGRLNAMEVEDTDLLLYHGALGTPTIDFYENYVLDDVELEDDLSFGEFGGAPSDYFTLSTDNYGIDMREENGTTSLATYDLPLSNFNLEGKAGVVYASGFENPENNNDGAGFSLMMAMADGTSYELSEQASVTTQVQIINNSPDSLMETADIYVNGNLTVEDLAFRDATSFIDLPADEDLEIVLAHGSSMSSDDGEATFLYNLESDQQYVLTISGLINSTDYEDSEPLNLIPYSMATQESGSADEVSLLIFNGSLDAGNEITGISMIDIREVGLGLGPITDDLMYGEYTEDYLTVETDNYYYQITNNEQTYEIDTYEAFLEDAELGNRAIVAFTSGFVDVENNNNGPEIGLWIALPDGTTLPLAELGETPINNFCSEAQEISIEELNDCPGNAVSGDLTAAWNGLETDTIPSCESIGILPDVFYTFNTGDMNELTINIESMVEGGSEIGYQLYTACTEEATNVSQPCVFDASNQGDIVIEDVETDADYILRIFTNLDAGNEPGEFNLCISGQVIDNINELDSPELIEIYPNPSDGKFTISNGSESTNLSIDVLDLEGRSVYKEELTITPNGQTELNLSKDLSDGVYMMRIIRDHGLYEMKKIVIE